jgi:hypothetical protein
LSVAAPLDSATLSEPELSAPPVVAPTWIWLVSLLSNASSTLVAASAPLSAISCPVLRSTLAPGSK